MPEAFPGAGRPLRIVHVLRAPVGGLFRHVLDLARGQLSRGHAVGLVTDRSTGGATADRLLGELEPRLALGLVRLPMHRNPAASDAGLVWRIARHVHRLEPDVVHGHGSKGGLYARMSSVVPGCGGPLRVYTPHGGSLNYRPGTTTSRVFMQAERLMASRTHLLLFESTFVANRYLQSVGDPPGLWRVVHNGIAPSEFVPVEPKPDAADLVYVGELRTAKGIDTLLEAMALASRTMGRLITAILAGTGPDEASLVDLARRLGLSESVTFAGLVPAREAFGLGRLLVVPSRAESLPYVVLEAAGARIPIIATRVGGIPEIFGPYAGRLLAPDDVPGLAARIAADLSLPDAELALAARRLAQSVEARFSLDGMVEAVVDAYRDALVWRVRARSSPRSVPTVSFNQPEA